MKHKAFTFANDFKAPGRLGNGMSGPISEPIKKRKEACRAIRQKAIGYLLRFGVKAESVG